MFKPIILHTLMEETTAKCQSMSFAMSLYASMLLQSEQVKTVHDSQQLY